MVAEAILLEVQDQVVRRNPEVVERLLVLLDRPAPIPCKYCEHRDDYVYCKRTAKKFRRELGQARGVEKYRLVSNWHEFDKAAKEFRALMVQQGQCTCAIF